MDQPQISEGLRPMARRRSVVRKMAHLLRSVWYKGRRSFTIMSSPISLMTTLTALAVLSACPPHTTSDGGVGHADAGGLTDAGLVDAARPDASTSSGGDGSVGRPEVVINELMARNTQTLADENGEFDDWL